MSNLNPPTRFDKQHSTRRRGYQECYLTNWMTGSSYRSSPIVVTKNRFPSDLIPLHVIPEVCLPWGLPDESDEAASLRLDWQAPIYTAYDRFRPQDSLCWEWVIIFFSTENGEGEEKQIRYERMNEMCWWNEYRFRLCLWDMGGVKHSNSLYHEYWITYEEIQYQDSL